MNPGLSVKTWCVIACSYRGPLSDTGTGKRKGLTLRETRLFALWLRNRCEDQHLSASFLPKHISTFPPNYIFQELMTDFKFNSTCSVALLPSWLSNRQMGVKFWSFKYILPVWKEPIRQHASLSLTRNVLVDRDKLFHQIASQTCRSRWDQIVAYSIDRLNPELTALQRIF